MRNETMYHSGGFGIEYGIYAAVNATKGKIFMADSKEHELGIPIGLGMAMSMNADAMKYFSGLSDDGRREVIRHAVAIDSKAEMKAYVEEMAKKAELFKN